MMHPLSWLEEVTCAPLSDRAVRLANLLCLVYRNRDTGLICPTRQTMADRLGCSIDTVKRAVAELSKAGWIVVVPGRWRGAPSSYQLSTPSGNVVALSTPKGGQTFAKTPSRDRDGAQATRERGADVHPFERKSGIRKGGRPAPERGADVHPPYKNHGFNHMGAPDAKGGQSAIRQAARKPAPPPPGAVIDRDDADGIEAWNRWLRSEGFGPLEASSFLAEAGPLRGYAVPKRYPPSRPDDAETARRFFTAYAEQSNDHDRRRAIA